MLDGLQAKFRITYERNNKVKQNKDNNMNITADVTEITYRKKSGSKITKQFGSNAKGQSEMKKNLKFLTDNDIKYTMGKKTITVKKCSPMV